MANASLKKNVTLGSTTVCLIEENGVVTVKIQSEDAVVHMNDELIWSIGNEKEEFKRIPQKLHKYIVESGYDYLDYNEKGKKTIADTYIEQEQLTLYIPVNQNENIHARFDLITSVEDVKDHLLITENEEDVVGVLRELEIRFNVLKEAVETEGYKLLYSHDMGEWAYAWWDIVFKAKDFHVGSIREIMKEVHEFNQFVKKIRSDYHC